MKLGPVSCSKVEQRWTSRIGSDGLFSCRETKGSALKSFPTSSPPTGVWERSMRRDPVMQQGLNSHRDASTPPESSPRNSMERDLVRNFQSSPDKALATRRSPSPPSKRADLPHRISIKTEGNAVPIPMSLEAKPWGNLASSPRDEICYGAPDYRRRSPSPLGSPRAHPVSSPRGSPGSSSHPPGFGPQLTQRNNAGKPSRNATNNSREIFYKSRICRGPNLKENFATRIAYRRGTSSTASTAALSTNTEERSREAELPKSVGHSTPGPGTTETNLGYAENLDEVSCGPAMGRPPTLHFNISSDISFEDFSRRLAAEAASSVVTENQEDSVILEPVELVSDAAAESKVFADTTLGEGDLSTDPSHQQDVDDLKKWFGRISASADAAKEDDRTRRPESHAEASPPEIKFPGGQDSLDQLDSRVLSFFDTIRSQALLERQDLPLENGSAGERGNEMPRMTMDSQSYARTGYAENSRRPDRSQQSDQSKSTEVERFFQLFTEGKPVYSQGEPPSAENRAASPLQRYRENASSGLTSKVDTPVRESDTGGLERWFAALAAGNQFD